jgi:heme-degrading monooxygenase HmoA
MFIATNRIMVKTGYGDTLASMFKARGAVQDHAGFISFELWKMNNTPEHEDFLVVTHWESEEHHHTWTRSDAFRSAHAGGPPDFLLGPGEFHTYDVVHRLEASGAAAAAD